MGNLSYNDFDNFAEHYSLKRYRSTGRLPSPQTVRSKQFCLVRAAELAECPSPESLGTLLGRSEGVLGLLEALYGHMTSGAVQNYFYALKDYADYALKEGWIEESALTADLLPASNPRAPINVYSEAEIEVILGAARVGGPRWWAFLSFLAETGRRVGEALSLEWTWLRLEQTPPYVQLPMTKNGIPQYVPLTSALAGEVFTPASIAKMKAEACERSARSGKVYPFPWAYPSTIRRFNRLCEKVGVEGRGFHCFRHTKATSLIAAGAPLQAVAALLGHANVATTDRVYNHATALSYGEWVN